jgi:hypothetical protein
MFPIFFNYLDLPVLVVVAKQASAKQVLFCQQHLILLTFLEIPGMPGSCMDALFLVNPEIIDKSLHLFTEDSELIILAFNYIY